MRTLTITITVPDGVDVQVGTAAPSAAPQAQAGATTPSCPSHGPMYFKSGTNKAGKPYSGYFCQTEGCETTPVWTSTR